MGTISSLRGGAVLPRAIAVEPAPKAFVKGECAGPPDSPDLPVLTRKGAMALLHCGEGHLDKLIERGMPVLVLAKGGKQLFSREACIEWVKAVCWDEVTGRRGSA